MESDSRIPTVRLGRRRRLTLMMPNYFLDVLRELGNVPIEKL